MVKVIGYLQHDEAKDYYPKGDKKEHAIQNDEHRSPPLVPPYHSLIPSIEQLFLGRYVDEYGSFHYILSKMSIQWYRIPFSRAHIPTKVLGKKEAIKARDSKGH